MTLVELTVSVSLMVVAAVIFLSVLASVQKGIERQSGRSQTNDQARLALEEIDHEIRSGNLLYDPSLENDPSNLIYPGMSLRIYTQVNANLRDPGNQCVQWRITNASDKVNGVLMAQQLQVRRWATTWRSDPDKLVTDWLIVATGIVNRTVNPQVSAFSLDPDPAKGGRTIVVNLLVNQKASSGSNTSFKESLTGRNTEYGFPSNVCVDIPPY
jgi:hypothetical protein